MAGGGGPCQRDRHPLITLVRHPAVAVAPGLCYGRLDLDLADPASARDLAARCSGVGPIWTSPARRCRLVAEAAGAHTVDDRLLELDFGTWEGLPWDAVPRDALDRWAADPARFAPPGGETGAALTARVRAFAAALPGGDHVVITHGGPLKVLLAVLGGLQVDLLAPAPPIGSVTRLG